MATLAHLVGVVVRSIAFEKVRYANTRGVVAGMKGAVGWPPAVFKKERVAVCLVRLPSFAASP
jgi:hypothetical protein